MKIQGNRPPDAQELNRSGVERSAPAAAKDNAAVPKRPSTTDRIDLSGTGREVAEIKAAIDRLPDVREERVRALREAIVSGKYTPDASKIAARMLEEL